MNNADYLPIEDYGVIGNMRTVALVGRNGSIDWLCYPKFDSPSVFAGILDRHKGGCFEISPAATNATYKQFYWPDTNVLITRFAMHEGIAELTDFMPIIGEHDDEQTHNRLIRILKVVRGTMNFTLHCGPAFNYARDDHSIEITDHGACFRSADLSLGLSSRIALAARDGAAGAEFCLQEGETAAFVLERLAGGGDCHVPLSSDESELLFRDTVAFWRGWLAHSTYKGRWREMVKRSALVLKLLTYEPTGAIVAAPTTSLPEFVGGERNWDYRYTWIRDAAFTIYGFMRIGFTEEAAGFMQWLEARSHEREPDGSLQIMYSIDGQHKLIEETLDHLEGYRGSKPVRIGNGAYHQLQLDIYGELLDSVYLFNKYGRPISYDLWTEIRELVNWVCDHWQMKDQGIWEIRGQPRCFVYSKLMIWVALDRGLRLADKRSFPADRSRWLNARDTVYEEIMANGWNDKLQAFSQYYGGDTLDAANLMLPLVFFLSPTDPRMLKTLEAIRRTPENGGLMADNLVYRYNADDGFDNISGDEGTFNLCTFWLVEAMTRAGMVDDARLIFERMLGYANHLGLYAEEIGPTGEALGNFPQAFTHLALISAAFNLDRTLGAGG